MIALCRLVLRCTVHSKGVSCMPLPGRSFRLQPGRYMSCLCAINVGPQAMQLLEGASSWCRADSPPVQRFATQQAERPVVTKPNHNRQILHEACYATAALPSTGTETRTEADNVS